MYKIIGLLIKEEIIIIHNSDNNEIRICDPVHLKDSSGNSYRPESIANLKIGQTVPNVTWDYLKFSFDEFMELERVIKSAIEQVNSTSSKT